ncbi:MAG TPA: c-type cytochrome [Terriglobia bacterium]|nr:c-type cytochrome [Terriglobia bacterium]
MTPREPPSTAVWLAGTLPALARALPSVALLLCLMALEVPLAPAQQTATAPGAKPAESGTPALASGEEIFRSHCAACHGLDARGGEHAPNIATDPKVRARSDRERVNIVTHGVPRAGMPAFDALLAPAEIQAVVRYLRRLGGSGSSAPLAGDAKLGETLFFGKADCASCHMLNGKGGYLASDLSSYGGAHSPAEIRNAILQPANPSSSDAGAATVTTRNGERLKGMVRNEDNFSLQLLDDQGKFHLLMKSELATFERDPRSPMPSDYGSRLTAAEVDALVAYLASEGSHSAAEQDVRRHHRRAQPQDPLKPGWKGP